MKFLSIHLSYADENNGTCWGFGLVVRRRRSGKAAGTNLHLRPVHAPLFTKTRVVCCPCCRGKGCGRAAGNRSAHYGGSGVPPSPDNGRCWGGMARSASCFPTQDYPNGPPGWQKICWLGMVARCLLAGSSTAGHPHAMPEVPTSVQGGSTVLGTSTSTCNLDSQLQGPVLARMRGTLAGNLFVARTWLIYHRRYHLPCSGRS